MRLKNPGELSALRQDFKEATGISIEAIAMDAEIMEFTLDEMENGCTMIVTILSAVLFAFSCLMTVAVIMLISQASAGKATKITPIKALRQGMESHSFQKNHMPLHKSKGPVSLLLGLKQVVFYKRTYLMTGVRKTSLYEAKSVIMKLP